MMHWKIKPKPDETKVAQLAQSLNVAPLVAYLLVQRGIETFEEARAFFRPDLNQLHDPYLMKDMDVAVNRILKAINQKERILIFGDYDVDGTTGVALLFEFLQNFTDLITTYIPDRYTEGYGVSYEGIDFASDNNITLVIAIDCGIKAIDKIAYAQNKGIDFIICDHHLPGPQLPNAVAILNPKQNDCRYPFKELCGCGVGFKLIQALARETGLEFSKLLPYLDLVATAIGADIVPITGENRILASHGLNVINTAPRVGFQALLETVKKKKLTITDVVFVIAPRINAAGRMKHGEHAVALLTEKKLECAKQQAAEIEKFNAERKETDKQITEEALLQIEENNKDYKFTNVVYGESWHHGVLGIVASRITETYYRPTVVFTKNGDFLVASARSIRGYDIYQALENCSPFIEQFGGHNFAAGLKILEKNFISFKNTFEETVSKTIDSHLLTPEIEIDAVIDFTDITPKFYRILKQFAPFGPGNRLPVFLTKNIQDTGGSRPIGKEHKHLRLMMRQKKSAILNGIGFNLGQKYPLISNDQLFSAVYSIDENEWNGQIMLQLRVKDLRN